MLVIWLQLYYKVSRNLGNAYNKKDVGNLAVIVKKDTGNLGKVYNKNAGNLAAII